jgi:excisionase family DNA binding protein
MCAIGERDADTRWCGQARCKSFQDTIMDESHPAGGMSPVNDVCARNKVGRSYLYAEIKAGRLRAIKVGRHTHITHSDEIAWRNSLPVLASAA